MDPVRGITPEEREPRPSEATSGVVGLRAIGLQHAQGCHRPE